MQYTYDQLEELAINAIQEHETPFISHLLAYLPCASSTFYLYELEKSEAIKDEINKIKVGKKTKVLNKMMKSDSASALIASYKLLGDEEEVKRLTGQQLDLTSGGKEVTVSSFTMIPPPEQLDNTEEKDDE